MQSLGGRADRPGVQTFSSTLSIAPESTPPQDPGIPAIIITLCSARDPGDKDALRRCLSVVEDIDRNLRRSERGMEGTKGTIGSELRVPELIDQWFETHSVAQAQKRVGDLTRMIEWMGKLELLDPRQALEYLEQIEEHCAPMSARRNYGLQDELLCRSRASRLCCFEYEEEVGPQLALVEDSRDEGAGR